MHSSSAHGTCSWIVLMTVVVSACGGSTPASRGERPVAVTREPATAHATRPPARAGAQARPHRLATDGSRTCAVLSDGAVLCWGRSSYDERPLPIEPAWHGTRADEVVMGGALTCIRRGPMLDCEDFARIEDAGPAAVAPSLLFARGRTLCDFAPQPRPEATCTADPQADDRPVALFASPLQAPGLARFAHACALRASGTLACMFRFDGPTFRAETADALATDAVDVSVGRAGHVCWVRSNGHVRCAGSGHPSVVAGQLGDDYVLERERDVYCRDHDCNEGTEAELLRADVARMTDAVGVTVGTSHSCAWTRDGAAWCWGGNGYGELGDGTRESRGTPVRVQNLPPVVEMVASESRTCALDRDDGIWCWGRSNRGELGLPIDGGMPGEERFGSHVEGITGATRLVAGADVVCALSAGSLSCWGDQYANTGRAVPQRIEGLPAIATAAVWQDAGCAIGTDRTAWCWGAGEVLGPGALPTGVAPPPAVPRQVAQLAGADEVALDDEEICIRRGGVVACGSQLDMMPEVGVRDAVRLYTGSAVRRSGRIAHWRSDEEFEITSVAELTLRGSACVRHRRGEVECWRFLGHRGPTMTATGAIGVASTRLGAVCVLHTGGTVRCRNVRAELPGVSMSEWTDVGISDGVEIVAANSNVCVRRRDGTVTCFGEPSALIGDGRAVFAMRPVRISLPAGRPSSARPR